MRKRFGLRTVKVTGEAVSADQETTNKFPDAIKKIIEEKIYLLEECRQKYPILENKMT